MVPPKKMRIGAFAILTLVVSGVALPASHAVASIQPADISGIWASRVPGQGLNESTIPHIRGSVSTLYDVRLELNQSGDTVIGVLTLFAGVNETVYAVNGTVEDTEFTMTSFRTRFVDGYVVNVTGFCVLGIDGDSMLGDGFLWFGVGFPYLYWADAVWELDLVREDESGIVPLAVTLVIVAAISILVAVRMLRKKRPLC